jgi:hypothetical protein
MPAAPQVNLDIAFDGFNASVGFSLESVFDLLGEISAKAECSRFLDATAHRPVLRVRMACFHCNASFFHLTAVDTEQGRQRLCRLCGEAFELLE